MSKKYFDHDADLSYLKGKKIAVIGYGNQGRSQALNLRDSGADVFVGSPRKDGSEVTAREEGFAVTTIAQAAQEADILMLLLPDEIFPQVYAKEIQPYLRKNMVLCFASGYNVYYKTLDIPTFVDVILLAPRMIGVDVRTLFAEGSGAPALIAVDQDASGNALNIVLAMARGIGATKTGAIHSSFEEETIIDLMGEQALAGCSLFFTRTLYETLVEAGCDPDAIMMELYASGEFIAISTATMQKGLWNQLKYHSHTSQYGQQTRGKLFINEDTKNTLKKLIGDIKDGTFKEEWSRVQSEGMKEFDRVWEENLNHPMMDQEDKLYRLLGRR
jgi:ketol-acid reductoisomerase